MKESGRVYHCRNFQWRGSRRCLDSRGSDQQKNLRAPFLLSDVPED